jgi:cytidylate kinase
MLDHIEINILKIYIWAPKKDRSKGIIKREEKNHRQRSEEKPTH